MQYGAAIVALMLAAPLPLSAQTGGQTGGQAGRGTADATVATAAEYLAAAAAGDLYVKTASELVMRGEGGSAEVRRFAQKMAIDYQNTSMQLRTVAQAAGLRLGVPVMTAQQQAMIEQLQSANGAQRERVYMSQQVTGHPQALALHQGYARNGDRPDIRAVALMAAQVVEGHLPELQRLTAGG